MTIRLPTATHDDVRRAAVLTTWHTGDQIRARFDLKSKGALRRFRIRAGLEMSIIDGVWHYRSKQETVHGD